jgi:hypothetical protein
MITTTRSTVSTLTFTEEDLLFDLDLRVLPVDPSDLVDQTPVHTTMVSELWSHCICNTYGCSNTCRRRAAGEHGAGMCY